MAKLDNSKRRLLQSVYARVRISDQGGGVFRPRRPLVKWGLVAGARPTRAEVDDVRRRLTEAAATGPDREQAAADLDALDRIGSLLFARGNPEISRVAPQMAEIQSETLVRLADLLLESRKQRIQSAIASLERIAAAYEGSRSQPFRGAAAPPEGVEVAAAPQIISLSLSPAATSVQALAEWALSAGEPAEEVKGFVDLAQQFAYLPQLLTVGDYPKTLENQVDHAVNVVNAFKSQVAVEPIGFLHLERMTFAPDGIERGELVYSVPLSPGEEVNIAHKEWSTTSEEFQKIVTDSLEEFSEEGVAEKSELSQSSSSEHQHSNGINTGVTASGGYGPVSITATLGVSIQDSASSTAEFSRNQSIAITRKASSRSKKEHKISFKVASAAGTEDQTVRKIKNPFPDQAVRIDYYQLIRKWEVKVYRYGIRLTYDITIPEPGSDVLSKIVRIKELNAALQEGFGGGSKLSWARFDLQPHLITPENYAKLAAQYNATVPPPPPERKDYDNVVTHDWKTKEEASQKQYWTIEVDVDEDYEIDSVVVDSSESHFLDEDSWLFNFQSVNDFFGMSGKRQLVYSTKFLGAAYVELRVGAQLRESALREWQIKAWNSMRDSAQARYFEQRVMLKDQLSQLTDELGAQDALSLRKFEREEVMKGVLRWLFGPDFEFVPKGVPADLYAKDESVKADTVWKEVLAHGEVIKFLHHAIEWENVLYFLYPYFWSHISRWELKKYLDHPDPMHRAFLKSGSARVVLTIRPGFERDFVSFLETGSFDGLGAGHPYLTIIEEMENFAKTNYPGIPPANPEEAAMKEEGVQVGIWYEYTPTSALDIAFNEALPEA